MDIVFSPQRSDTYLELSVKGNTITVNGEKYDLDTLPDIVVDGGIRYPQTYPFGHFMRKPEGITAVVILPLSADPIDAHRFPNPMYDVKDGSIDLSKITTDYIEPVKEEPNEQGPKLDADKILAYQNKFSKPRKPRDDEDIPGNQ